MKKALLNIVAALSLISLSSGLVFASGSSGIVNVDYIDTQGSGNFVIKLTAAKASLNPDLCGGAPAGANRGFLTLAANNVNKEAIYSSVLAALVNGNNVSFWLVGCSGNNPRISSAVIYR